MADKLVVVGGNSYIGHYLAGYAGAQGRDAVSVNSADCDLLDPDAVSEFFASLGRSPCVVVFLAVVNKHRENSFRALELNNRIAENFARGHRTANVESVVWFSSVDVYGAGPRLPITEETPVAPDTWYGLSKYNGEWIVTSSGEVECPVTVLRIPGVYGNSRNDRSVVGRMASDMLRDARVVINGSGDVLRDYVFIDDLARLVMDVIPLRHQGTVNVATGSSRSVSEIAATLGDVLGTRFETQRAPGDSRQFDLCFDNSRLRRLLPGFRFTDLRDGMAGYRRG